MRIKKKLIIFISTTLLTTLQLSTSQAAGYSYPGKWGFECGVTVMDPHISTTLNESGQGLNIKIDAYSKCKLMQRNVILEVELYKRGALSPIYVFRTKTNPALSSSSGFLVTNYQTYRSCATLKATQFWGRARGTAIINGKQYSTPWVLSGVTKPIKCGTL